MILELITGNKHSRVLCARKGIFVPRELVNKLGKLVALYDVEGLTIGAYVTNILIKHLVENRDVINNLSSEGEKTVAL